MSGNMVQPRQDKQKQQTVAQATIAYLQLGLQDREEHEWSTTQQASMINDPWNAVSINTWQ